ncbi:MAG: beta-lactamase family protein [Myxococcales bacterium FL481]|nr:MAG: beta-lactamase family protein [Myxococcales bacterium FL481]
MRACRVRTRATTNQTASTCAARNKGGEVTINCKRNAIIATIFGGLACTADSSGGRSLQARAERVWGGASRGGVTALVRRGGMVETAAVGTANPEGDPLVLDSVIAAGSVTKLFTATLIYQLHENGRLELTESLGTYLPMYKDYSEVTLEQLLSHRGGVPNYTSNPEYVEDLLRDPERILTTEELVAYASFEAPALPGQRFAYSNTGYSLLGMVIEQVTQAPLAEVLNEGIVAPLDLTATSLADPPGFPPDLVSGWLYPPNFGLPEHADLPVQPLAAPFSGCQADCGLITTVFELQVVLDALFAGELISNESLEKLTSSEADAPNQGYGVEIYALGESDAFAYGHGGGGAGYTTLAVLEPESGDLSIFFANNDAIDLASLWSQYGL